jgi:hypothetical protein
MDCLVCTNLERAYEARLSEYIEARSSACYRVSTKQAAQKNVEMERARYELEEHRFVCVSGVRVPVLLPERGVYTQTPDFSGMSAKPALA